MYNKKVKEILIMAQIFDLSKEVKKRKSDKVKLIPFTYEGKKYLIKQDFETFNIASKELSFIMEKNDLEEGVSPEVVLTVLNRIPEVLEKIVGKDFVDKVVKLDIEQVIDIYIIILTAIQDTGSIEEAYKLRFSSEEEKEPEFEEENE